MTDFPQKLIGNLYFPAEEKHFLPLGSRVDSYQKPQRDVALRYVKDKSLCIDVGAHVGIFSRHFAFHFERVMAFEPIENLRECLVRNVPRNVEIVPKAVSSFCGPHRMVRQSTSNSGCSYLDSAATSGDLVDVDVVTIDSLHLTSLGLIKIDVQGSDHLVLRGAEATLRRFKPVVLVEEKPVGGANGPTEHIDDMKRFMSSIGATIREKVGGDRIYTFR